MPGPLETIRSVIAVNPNTGQPVPGGQNFAAVAVESPNPRFLTGTYTDQVVMPSNIFLPCNVTITGSLTVQQQANWVNPVLSFGADPTGTIDSTTAINNALATIPAGGGVVYLPAGSYLLNTSTVLSLQTTGTVLTGDGPNQTFLVIGASFTGAEAVNVAAGSCVVRDIGIVGSVNVVTSNPVANGIELSGGFQHCRFQRLWFQYVNGWCIESVASASAGNLDTMIESVVIRNCAAGVHVQGLSGSSFQAEHFLTDIQMQQMGASTGGSANLSALYLQDCQDVLVENLNIGVVAGTGSAVRVAGAVASAFFTNPDVGGGTNTVTIADSGGNSPGSILFTNGTFQQSTAGPGLSLTGGAQDIELDRIYFHRNFTAGIVAANTGNAPCTLSDCRWNTNNQAAAATQYDADFSSSTTKWMVRGGLFSSAIGASTGGKVSNPVNDPSNVATFFGTNFNGSGTTVSNVAASGTLLMWQCIILATQGIGPMTTLGDLMYGGATGGNTTRLAGQTTAFPRVLTQTGTGSLSAAPSWVTQVYAGVFGTGSDSAITFDGVANPVAGATLSGSTYTLTRDILATNMTVNNGITVKPVSFRIFCQGTLTNNGTISAAGAAASGSSAGAGTGNGSLQGSGAGGAGGTGVNGAGGNGTAENFGNAGGAGGAGTSGAAGSGGTVSAANNTSATSNILITPIPILQGGALWNGANRGMAWGPGGGGGGSDASSNAGGGGGGGGGIVAILAWAVNNGSGTITVQGGAGGNAAGGNAGGGGGGAGGLIIAYTLAAWTAGTLTVTGGALGNKAGTGSNGNPGGAGVSLNVVLA